MAQIRLGELLVRAQVVSEAQLTTALHEQKRWGGRLGSLLVRMNLLTEDLLVKALSRQLNLPQVSLAIHASVEIPPSVRARVDQPTCERLLMLPIGIVPERRTVVVASADPLNVFAVDELSRRLGARIELAIAAETELLQAISRAFGRGAMNLGVADSIAPLEPVMAILDNAGRPLPHSSAQSAGRAPIRLAPEDFSSTHHASSSTTTQTTVMTTASAPSAKPGDLSHDVFVLSTHHRNCLRALAALFVEKGLMTETELATEVERRRQALLEQ